MRLGMVVETRGRVRLVYVRLKVASLGAADRSRPGQDRPPLRDVVGPLVSGLFCGKVRRCSFCMEVRGMCQEYQDAVQLRSAGEAGGDSKRRRLQFVRKISGFNKPSKANEAAFVSAVDAIAGACAELLGSLETNSPPKNREEEAARLKARSVKRFAVQPDPA